MYVSNYLSFTDACPCFTQRIHVTHQSLSTPPTINMHVSPSIPTQLNFNLLCITLYTLMFIFIHSSFLPTTDRPDTGKVTAAGKVGTESSKSCSFLHKGFLGSSSIRIHQTISCPPPYLSLPTSPSLPATYTLQLSSLNNSTIEPNQYLSTSFVHTQKLRNNVSTDPKPNIVVQI